MTIGVHQCKLDLPAVAQLRQEIQLACFRVGSELYAFDIMRIKEIIRPQRLTPVPKAPPFVEGVIDLRGSVVPVVDLHKRFDQPTPPAGRKTRVIICAVAGKIIGLLVDEVVEVHTYGRQEIFPAPQFLKGKESEFFLGVCHRQNDLVLILDLERILSSNEKIALDILRQD